MANTRFKVDNGLVVTGTTEFYQRIDSFANAHFQNDLFVVSGNLTVNGSLVYANVAIGTGGIRAVADQQDLGNTTNRFNLFGYRVQIDDTLIPLANGVPIGNTTRRFEVFSNNLNTTTITIGAASINSTIYTGTASNANTVGGLAANGIIVRTGTSTAVARSINVSSSGISITNGDGIAGNPTLSLVFGPGLFANANGIFVNLSSVSVGTLPIARGGTGGPDRTSALNNLLPAQNTSVQDYVLRTNGTDASWVAAVGPTGYTGSQGPIGFTGSQGPIGYTGSQGPIGYTGSAGFTGSVGFVGSQGTPGGSNTQIQFNDSGAANGSVGFTFNKATTTFSVPNIMNVGGNTNITGIVNVTISDNNFVSGVTVQNSNTGSQAQAKFSVNNDAGAGAIFYKASVAGGARWGLYSSDTATFDLSTNGASRLQVYANGVSTYFANIAMTNNHVTEPTFKAYREHVNAITISTTSQTLDLSTTNIFNLTLANSATLTFSNPPSSGTAYSLTLYCKQDATGSRTITWPAAVKWPNASTPTLSTGANKIDIFNFFTLDGGTTYVGALSLANVG